MLKMVSGVTLIELMIVVAIIALIALFGVPLGGRWIASSQIAETKALLFQGYSTARALALRNPLGVTGVEAAAGMKLSNTGMLLVCKGEPNEAACSTNDESGIVVWQTDLIRGTGVTVTAATVSLDKRGIASGSATYSVSKGQELEYGTLDLD